MSGQRLLLEAVSRSILLLEEKPSPESINAYKKLANELKIKYPLLLIIAGAMLTFLGAIICSSSLRNQGIAKVNAGFFASQRQELCQSMVSIVSKENQNVSEHSKDISEVVPLPTI